MIASELANRGKGERCESASSRTGAYVWFRDDDLEYDLPSTLCLLNR